MAVRLLLVLVLLLGAALGAWLLLAPADDAPVSVALDRKGVPSTEREATSDASLVGAPAPEAPDPFVGADVTTTLGAIRMQPPNVPAGAVARLGEIVDADPDLLEHLIDVAIGEEPLRDGLLPPDYPYSSPHQITAMWALRALGIRAARAIAARLEKEDAPTFRDRLLERLRDLGADAAPATEVLVTYLRDDTLPDDVRSDAIWILGGIGAPGRETVPDLVAILRDPEDPLFASALSNLYLVGGDDPRVMDAYRDLLSSDDFRLLQDVLEAIAVRMRGDAELLRSALEPLLSFDQADVRRGALWALMPIGVHDPSVIRLVGLRVEDAGLDEELAAAALLAASGEAGRAELLDVARRTEDQGVALRACRRLDEAGVPLASHPEILTRLLGEAEGTALDDVGRLLCSLSPPPRAKDLLPLARAEVEDVGSPRRFECLWILPCLGGADEAVLALLEKSLADETLGPTALDALGRMARAADRAVPLLLTRLDYAPGLVIEALGNLAATNEGARKALRQIAATHESEEVRQDAAATLEQVKRAE